MSEVKNYDDEMESLPDVGGGSGSGRLRRAAQATHRFAMKETTSGREKIKSASEIGGRGLDSFSFFGTLRKKKREEIKKRFEDAGIDLKNIDIDQAFRLLTRPEALFAGIRRMITTVPRAAIKTTEAITRAGMGVLTAPKYIYQGMATIPGNLKNTLWNEFTDESKGYADRWKGIFKSAARTIYQPFTKPGAAFAKNRLEDVKDAFAAGKSALATITINPFKRIAQGARKAPHTVKNNIDHSEIGEEAQELEKDEASSQAALAETQLQQMIQEAEMREDTLDHQDENIERAGEIEADLGEPGEEEGSHGQIGGPPERPSGGSRLSV